MSGANDPLDQGSAHLMPLATLVFYRRTYSAAQVCASIPPETSEALTFSLRRLLLVEDGCPPASTPLHAMRGERAWHAAGAHMEHTHSQLGNVTQAPHSCGCGLDLRGSR